MTRPVRRRPVMAVVVCGAGAALVGCGTDVPTTAAEPSRASSPAAAASSAPAVGSSGPDADANRARCEAILATPTVRGLLGGQVDVGGGAARVTGNVTSTRCDWTAANSRYLTIIALDGPGLPARAATVTAGATPVPGRPGVSYEPRRGLLVLVGDRLYQVVAGGAGTAQARTTGLKAIEAIRAAAG